MPNNLPEKTRTQQVVCAWIAAWLEGANRGALQTAWKTLQVVSWRCINLIIIPYLYQIRTKAEIEFWILKSKSLQGMRCFSFTNVYLVSVFRAPQYTRNAAADRQLAINMSLLLCSFKYTRHCCSWLRKLQIGKKARVILMKVGSLHK